MGKTSAPSVVVIRSRLLGPDLESELLHAGLEVHGLEPEVLSRDFVRSLLDRRKPMAVVGINYSPELAWLITREGYPYICWTIDPLPVERLVVLEGTIPDLVHPWLHRSQQVEGFRAMGLSRAQWLPLAAPRRRFRGPPHTRGRGPTFAGSSLLDEKSLFDQAMDRWAFPPQERALLEAGLEPLVTHARAVASFRGFLCGDALVPQSLAERVGEPLPRIADALDAWLAWKFRRDRVRSLPSVEVFGDGGWQEVVGDRWKGALADGAPLSEVYASSLASVDVPRLHQRDIATLRAVDVAACGGCLVAESSRDLVQLLRPDEEFLTYGNEEELQDLLASLAADPFRSLQVGNRALERARREHTLGQRVERILQPLMNPRS